MEVVEEQQQPLSTVEVKQQQQLSGVEMKQQQQLSGVVEKRALIDEVLERVRAAAESDAVLEVEDLPQILVETG